MIFCAASFLNSAIRLARWAEPGAGSGAAVALWGGRGCAGRSGPGPGFEEPGDSKVDARESAVLLHTVLKAHGSDVDAALKSAKEYLAGI